MKKEVLICDQCENVTFHPHFIEVIWNESTLIIDRGDIISKHFCCRTCLRLWAERMCST